MGRDKRPDAVPKKRTALYQTYSWYMRVRKMRISTGNRLDSIEKGKSHMDAGFEYAMMDDMHVEEMEAMLLKTMINYGSMVGPVWTWLSSIKGLGPNSMSAQLLALIDDIEKFPTVSKLWRYAGWAVIDGEIDRCQRGETSPYHRKLKSLCWLIVDQFIKQQTPVYVDLYYAEKERQRKLHPEKIKVNGKWKYNDGHLHYRAMRKVAKIFLQHLWVIWRESEGLYVSEPWIMTHGGHGNYIAPPNWPM